MGDCAVTGFDFTAGERALNSQTFAAVKRHDDLNHGDDGLSRSSDSLLSTYFLTLNCGSSSGHCVEWPKHRKNLRWKIIKLPLPCNAVSKVRYLCMLPFL